MGFFDGVGEFFSGLTSAVSDFFSGVVELIESVGLNNIAELAAAIAAIAIPGIGLPELIMAIAAIAEVVGLIAKVLGLNDNENEAEEIGFKSEIADMKPEDFDNNMSEYNKYLSNYKLNEEDKERFDLLTEDEKLRYKVMGLGIQLLGIESELSITNLSECVRDLTIAKMSKEDISECVQACARDGVTDMTDITSYLTDKTTIESKEIIGEALTSAISTRYPELSKSDIVMKLGDIAEVLNNLE